MPDAPSSNHAAMTPEEFREQGRRMIDWIADYWKSVEQRGVTAPIEPGSVYAALPDGPPESAAPTAETWDGIFRDLDEIVAPNLMHWQHPNYFGFFPANSSFAAILGELACAGMGVQGMLWETSPAITEVETRVLDWMADLLDLPESYRSTATHAALGGGVIQGTASEATLVAMVAARARVLDADPNARPVIYTSTQSHSSVIKAAMIAGLARHPEDREHLRVIGTNADLSIDVEQLRAAIDSDRAEGRAPAWIGLTSGTTATGAFDDIAAVAAIRDELCPRAWIHVDAAWAGVAAVCPEHRGFHAGLEHAESYVTNAHKWLLTNFDCSMFYTKDRRSLNRAMSINPSYLKNAASEAGAVIDYRDWHVELGRRFRALKLWFVLRQYGVDGLRSHIRRHVEWTEAFETRLRRDERFDLPTPRSLSLLTFRLRAGDEPTRELHRRLNASRRTYLTHTLIPIEGAERSVIRFCIGAPLTERRHVDDTLELIRATAGEVLSG
ncbi:MAG: pyridoxal-dependent decarboxylase [Planctomycetota bacterium]